MMNQNRRLPVAYIFAELDGSGRETDMATWDGRKLALRGLSDKESSPLQNLHQNPDDYTIYCDRLLEPRTSETFIRVANNIIYYRNILL
jgi:hypothetical protein